jgi:hypothetical protein
MAKMPRAEEFCTWEPHFEGEEVFGSQKCKGDVSLGSEHESHMPDRVNFSRLRISTRSTRVGGTSCSLNDIPEELFPDLHEHPIPIYNCRATHVTAIQEIACKKMEWHIARLLKTLAKACFAQQAITKKNYTSKIVQGNRDTAAPTYIGVIVHYKKNKKERMEFFFYNDDIERCVKGTRWR